jgi:hypothetical protein
MCKILDFISEQKFILEYSRNSLSNSWKKPKALKKIISLKSIKNSMNIQGSKISLESGKTKTPKSFTREVIEKSFGTSLVFDNVFKRTPSKNVCLAREYGDNGETVTATIEALPDIKMFYLIPPAYKNDLPRWSKLWCPKL